MAAVLRVVPALPGPDPAVAPEPMPLRVDRGNPSREDVAALVVALLAVAAAAPAAVPRPAARPGWTPAARHSAPGAWTA